MSGKAAETRGSKKSDKAKTDDGGAWMNEGATVAKFLLRFTSENKAEAPLKNILRMVSKRFKDDAEEGIRSIEWKGPGANVRDRDGRFKDRLPNLKSIDCYGLDTLKDLNGCPRGLEALSCCVCSLIENLAPLASCTNLRKLTLNETDVTSLKPLMRCVKLEWLCFFSTDVSDLSPLSSCIILKALRCGAQHVSDLHQLRFLDIGSSDVDDLSPLSLLEVLDCSYTSVSDLTPLSKSSELKVLNIYDAKEVESLSSLLMCKKLRYLNHGDLKDMNKEETDAYLKFMKEVCPELLCTRFSYGPCEWGTLPVALIHDWNDY